MGEGDLAGSNGAPTAQQASKARGVVRRPKGALTHEAVRASTCGRADRRGLDPFLEVGGGQQVEYAAGEHGLAGPRWPHEEEAVPTGGGDLEGELGLGLAADLVQAAPGF